LIDFLIDRHRENKRRFGGKREAEYQHALMELTDEEDEEDDYYRLNRRA
jgi:hypothetical protein